MLDNVNKDKKAHPYGVYEMPIPGCSFESKVIVRRKMAAQTPHQDYSQGDGTHRDMKAVEACQHEKGGALDT